MATYKEGYIPKRQAAAPTSMPKPSSAGVPSEMKNSRLSTKPSPAIRDLAQSSNRTEGMVTDMAEPLPIGKVKTGGGDYPTYKAGSSNAKSFNSAFGEASRAGKGEFEWQGRKYNTKKK